MACDHHTRDPAPAATRPAPRPSHWLMVTLALLASGCKEVDVENASSGEALCQEYFEACVYPILNQPITVAGRGTTVTCTAQGCHNVASGAGGAFRLFADAPQGSDDMTANYIASQAFTNISDPAMSKLLLEPLAGSFSVVGSHSGGDIFADANDDNYREIYYWISNPQASATESCPTLDWYAADPALRCLADGGS